MTTAETFRLTHTGGSERDGLPFISCSQGRRRPGRPTKCLLMLPPGVVHPRACTKGHPLTEGWSCIHFTGHSEGEIVAKGNALLAQVRAGCSVHTEVSGGLAERGYQCTP